MKTFRKNYTIKAPLQAVFEVLTNEKIIAYWTEMPATMDVSQNGKFSLWNGDIHGMNKYISQNKIIQEWYEKGWKEPSIVTMNISTKDGMTLLELIHENIPDKSYEGIANGWDEHYMHPMAEMAENISN